MSRDDWLDAFELEDLEDPELDALDGAVDRVLAGLEGLPLPAAVPPRRRRWPWVLGALVAAGLGVYLVPAGEVPAPPEPEPIAVVAPPPVVQPAPVVLPAPAPPPAPTPVVAATPAPQPVLEPGLLPGDGARLKIDGDAVVLSSGHLRYVHDATHEPGVRSVRLVDLPVEARPVGTAFDVLARGQVAALRIDEGRVQVVHDDGTVLADLAAGREAVALPDLDDDRDVRVHDTTGLSLGAVGALVPEDCLCRPQDVVASVARLRLLALEAP